MPHSLLAHAVVENDDPENTPYRVNYAETIAFAFAAIKELDAEVQALRAEVNALKPSTRKKRTSTS